MESRSIWHFIFMLIVSQRGISGDEIRLDQSPAVIKRPQETVKISCKISGFTMTSYYMHWIRQKPGKALEWIGRVDSGSSSSSDYLIYADAVKNHFTLSEDVSQSTQYLEAKSLREEDTAVYYCARDGLGFAYWGKGTRVIVSGEEPKPPAVFMMSSCGSSDSLIVGCLASGFSPPESVTFKWMDQSGKALSDFIQYPSGNTSLAVSHITISKTKFNQSKIICAAEHPSKTVNETFRKVNLQTPTLSLVPVTTPKSTSVMCVIEDFYPRMLSVQWKVNDKSMSQLKLESKQNEDTGFYTGYSFYEVSSETWNTNTYYTCEVTHNQGQPIHVTKNFKAKFTLTLKPPIERELFVNNKIVLEAVVSGDDKKTVQEASVSCTVKSVSVTSENIKSGNVLTDTSLFIRIHNVTINTKKWFDGETVTCTIREPNNNRDIKQEIRFGKGDGKKPSVFIYRPDKITDHVSLVCAVTSPNLGDAYLMWRVGQEPYIEGRTSGPLRQNDSTSVLSILTVTKQQYEKDTITCAVKHANMDNISAPLEVTTSQSEPPEPENGFVLNEDKDVQEEDEYRSLWSTATSFIFLFLFSLTYSAVLSLFKMKQ